MAAKAGAMIWHTGKKEPAAVNRGGLVYALDLGGNECKER
jgi:hypothetical protein